ncbi:MAG TPA: alpha/beta hydrolase [Rhizomicrobium sp.]|nr:alpha/beta hydrolase [Rhizomicrobium sp.]
MAAALCGCAAYNDPYYVHSVWRPADASDRRADVFFLTDRKPNPYWLPDKFDRAIAGASCGVMHVTVPPARLPRGEALYAQESGREALTCGGNEAAFAARIAVAARARNCGSVLIYVPGFNTGFETAVLRAAQLGLDTQWPCVTAAFSWNSAGRSDSYESDRANATAAEPLFADFLRALNRNGLRPSIIAHSMGTRLVLETVAGDKGVSTDEIIFAAPDISTAAFSPLVTAAWPRFQRLTIYTSDEDVALAISPRWNHGSARLGKDANGFRGIHSIDVIDASDAPADIIGHGYYGLSYEVLADMTLALAGETAEQRLSPRGVQPPTLELADDESYRLIVSWKRAPDVFSRIFRWLAGLIAS